jgi:hypothetical protein
MTNVNYAATLERARLIALAERYEAASSVQPAPGKMAYVATRREQQQQHPWLGEIQVSSRNAQARVPISTLLLA